MQILILDSIAKLGLETDDNCIMMTCVKFVSELFSDFYLNKDLISESDSMFEAIKLLSRSIDLILQSSEQSIESLTFTLGVYLRLTKIYGDNESFVQEVLKTIQKLKILISPESA